MTGTALGRCELLEKLGEGDKGVVCRARGLELNRPAARKLLPDAGVGGDRKCRPPREAQAASALNHANIVTIAGYKALK
jgi:hypothetical protein